MIGRRSLLPALVVLLAAVPASARGAPPDPDQALWCANAFIVSGGEASGADSELARRGQRLLAKTQMGLIEQGFGDEQIKTMTAAAHAQAAAQLVNGGPEPRYSYEDCLRLEEAAP